MKIKQTSLKGFLTPSSSQKSKMGSASKPTSVHKAPKTAARRSKRNAADKSSTKTPEVVNAQDVHVCENSQPIDSQSVSQLVSPSVESQLLGSELPLGTTPLENQPLNTNEKSVHSIDEVERSLDEVIADALTGEQAPTQQCTQDNPTIRRLEAELIDVKGRAEFEETEKKRLQNQVDLLSGEVEDFKNIYKNMKKEVKLLTKSNDNLRKELSKHQGMRKFATKITKKI